MCEGDRISAPIEFYYENDIQFERVMDRYDQIRTRDLWNIWTTA